MSDDKPKGRGRFGPREHRRHSPDLRAQATKRFGEQAMPMAVAAELGVPYLTCYFWWRAFKGNPVRRKPKAAA